MRVLLIGEHYSCNLGDGVISLSVRYLLKDSCDIELLDLSQKRGYETSQISFKRPKLRVKKILLRMKSIHYINEYIKNKRTLNSYLNEFTHHYDAAIYMGGSLFRDYFAIKQFYINKWLDNRKIPVLYNACGMSKISSHFFMNKLKQAVSMDNVKYISMRDSECEFKRFQYKDVISTYDCALIVSDLFEKKTRADNVIGIGFISKDFQFNRKFYKSVKALVSRLNEKNLKWEFFTNGALEDATFMLDCYKRLKNIGMVQYGSVAKIPHKPEELIRLISGYDRMVTCRLHSAIIGYSYLIPTCAVSWDKKIDCFYEKIGHSELVINQDMDVSWIMDNFINYSYDILERERLDLIKSEIKSNIDRILKICYQ